MAKPAEDRKTDSLPKVNWNDANLQTNYANVCNVSSTREEVTLLFGTNQTWNAGQKEVTVELNSRVILSPYAAKRMLMLLNNVVSQYEKRFGALSIDQNAPATAEKE